MNFPAVSAEYVIDLYERYLRDPPSVDAAWKPYFDELWGHGPVVGRSANSRIEVAVALMLAAYRHRGHFAAKLDPLDLWHPPLPEELNPEFHGIEEAALDRQMGVQPPLAVTPATPRAVLARLREVYCGSIGLDCAHVGDSEARNWLYAAAENNLGTPSPEARRAAVADIIRAHDFEQFLGLRFVGKKRFGADGAESMVVWFQAALARSVSHGVREVVIGGTSRGRLNVTANVLGKPLIALLHEFKGRTPFAPDVAVSGDVPYHFGYTGERSFDGVTATLTYCNNPSHLEAVDGVTLGRARARQNERATREQGVREVLSLLVHTDAAFAGQGVVAEILQLSKLPAYSTGGTIHLVINNQLGFTTAPVDGRSSIYCTDVARMIGAPVLHVNADDVDAVVRVANLAADYRERFKSDIIVDLVCYRRLGHNELDEPTFTQPLMYRAIAGHPTTRDQYVAKAVADGLLTAAEAEAISTHYQEELDAAYATLDGYRSNSGESPVKQPSSVTDLAARTGGSRATGMPIEKLRAIGEALSVPPLGTTANAKVVKQLRERGDAVRSGQGITWAFAEALAFGSLACEGRNIRFSGQDSPRGAFSQRHFLLVDQETGATVEPFNRIQEDQGRCDFVNSPLSEYSVLGFEYGYSLDAGEDFVVWEAQFGDFANVAQVIFDQFIVSGEDKWLDRSALTIMLPHGLEGQGPDHSSGRIERFLQMCAGGNIAVANCSTPANFFHLLRRQAKARERKPLIVFTTKSLLRHRSAISTLAEFTSGTEFQPVLGGEVDAAGRITRVVVCSGKVYYDLRARLNELDRSDVALVRVEQLYPFPDGALHAELARFPDATVLWCQEEPENMGAWSYMDRKIETILRRLNNRCEWPHYVGRPANASTAIGTNDEHTAGQAQLVAKALGSAEVQLEKETAAAR